MSPGGSIVASLKNINGFLAMNTSLDDLIHTDFKQERVVPKVMLYVFKEFILLLGRHPFNNKVPRMGEEGALHLGPERAYVYSDLSPEDKERYNADIRATNILLQGLPKEIYTLINHYTDAKDIWDNVRFLEGSELTKEDHESQLYDEFEQFCQNKRETIHDYYVRGRGNNARGTGAGGNRGAQNRVRNVNLGQARQIKCYNYNEYFKDKMLLTQAQENGVVLDEEQLLFIAGGQDNTVDKDMDELLV
nr:integrase, catalytic region, zinc finger, CCHC-type, peptidase aspartic, catalytic [Tanacetum cinerariifolium]